MGNYHFDFIAVSPIWRTRNTILPYLKATKRKAELWLELAEFSVLPADATKEVEPPPSGDLFTGGPAIKLPDGEKPYFEFRDDGRKLFKLGTGEAQSAADIRAGARKEVAMIRKRFDGSDKSILPVGHGTAGRLLLHLVVKDSDAWNTQLVNTGMCGPRER